MVFIYLLLDPVTGEIRYVGWTAKALATRLRQHLRDRCACHRTWWIRGLLHQGLRPQIQLLQAVPSEQWAEAERYWIAHFRDAGCPLTNGTLGGEGMLGHIVSPGTRAKLSKATKLQFEDPKARAAVSAVHKGKTISSEHRAIVGAATKRRWEEWRANGGSASPETRARISAARQGKPCSDEHRAKISATTKGRPKSPEHRAKLAQARRDRAARERATREERA